METAPSRKRLRRSTRSCYQCRKRKVKCQLTEEQVDTCAECIKSGTQCTLQPPEADLSSRESPARVNNQDHGSRLERIESLLKSLVEAQERSRATEGSFESEPTGSLWNDFLLQSTTDGTLPLPDEHRPAITQSPDVPDAKQSLVALLPSAQDAVTIVTNTTAWLWGAETPQGSVLKPDDTVRLLDVAAISGGSAMHVAKTLLLFALYMQQLPSSFDVQFLESQSVERAIELIVERVKLYVLAHEDEACSLDGLECLTLLASLQLNEGEIRSAWMTFRRILDFGRMKGLQNSFSLSARSSSCAAMALQRRLWLSTVCGDCYCSLFLGLEPGLGIAPFGPDDETWDDPCADDEANVQRRLCLVIARIAQRNAVGIYQDRGVLREIDKALDKLQDSLPASWWRAPSFCQDRSLDSAKEPNRLICQLWFFQARMFAHMPIAFGKPTEGMVNSLESCMEASRVTLQRYLGLHHAKDHLSRCRSVDQSAFLAAVVLLLAKAQMQQHKVHSPASRYDSDRALLEQVIDSFEVVGRGSREHVPRQISEILSTMLDIASANSCDPNRPLASGKSLDPEATIAGGLGTTEHRMEDVIASSIQPMFDVESPASHLINLLFATRRSARDIPEPTEQLSAGHGALIIDDFIDPTILQ